MTRPVLLIDNFDSFTFNLVDCFRRQGSDVRVVRNTIATMDAMAMAEQARALIVLSPGPGAPANAGCCLDLIGLAKGRLPLLGVCLGHQAIVQQAGGFVRRAPKPVHGKASLVEHDGAGPFAGLPNPLRVGRYHSLGTYEMPSRITVHATIDGLAMAVSDEEAMQVGLQFHPESILTTHGERLLANIIEWAGQKVLIEERISL